MGKRNARERQEGNKRKGQRVDRDTKKQEEEAGTDTVYYTRREHIYTNVWGGEVL